MSTQTICFTVSALDANRRRTSLKPYWLTRRQMEVLMLVYHDKDILSWSANAKTHRELKDKGLVLKLHKGYRFYTAALTENGQLLAESIEQAAATKAAKTGVRL